MPNSRVAVQTLTSPSQAEVVWNFDNTDFLENTSKFRVEGYINDELAGSDEVTFTTTANVREDIISVNKKSVTLRAGASTSITVTSKYGFQVSQEGDFFTYEKTSDGLAVNVLATATDGQTGSVTVFNESSSVTIKVSVSNIHLLSHLINKSATSCNMRFSTEVIPSLDMAAEFKIVTPVVGSSDFFGTYTTPNNAECFFVLSMAANCQVHAGTKQFNVNCDMKKPHVIYYDKDIVMLDGSQVGVLGCTELQSTRPMYLFCLNSKTSRPQHFYSGEFYYLKLWKSGELVADFLPCLDENDNVAIYDSVSKKIIKNELSGTDIEYVELDE